MNDTAQKPVGIFNIKIYEDAKALELGMVKKETEFRNKMTNASLAVISGLVFSTGAQTAFSYLAVGTSNTAVSASHTTLQAEITDTGLARAAGTPSRTTTSQTNDTASITYTWTASGSKTIEEVGIFNASPAGTMLCRALSGSTPVVNGNLVVATYTWQVVGN